MTNRMRFRHVPEIWATFPQLVAGALVVIDVRPDVDTADAVEELTGRARDRLDEGNESEFPEIRAWRRAFASMGLKPTQYRCASEALLRQLRTRGGLPHLHPLVDLCNAISAAYAIPVAAFDLDKISGDLEVRHAVGTESYRTFGGDIETPSAGEVIFADGAGNAHARRWTNRQSGLSAIGANTESVLVIAEAMHDTADSDVPRLLAELTDRATQTWTVSTGPSAIDRDEPDFQRNP